MPKVAYPTKQVLYQVFLSDNEEDEEFLYVTFGTLSAAQAYAQVKKDSWATVYISEVRMVELVKG